MIIKLLSSEIAASSANTIAAAKLVRIVNSNTAIQTVTVGSKTFSMLPNSVEIVAKSPTDTVQGNVSASSVAFTH